eukprot:CAMPEP_0206000344 /NCGR_PEP_ID=MMETSP1464-20131121/1413_1 /ASSEMBLY_ACC=CAM_ASM_001124 /TAXON_ID=119497 /ORGANISM="Exanthemachrysis gayraliae, Strain RCC1523" /LENGTH=541 /DNA_ID=CAMNT_0053373599 /DNA_START=158 /DNA_END=1780 /DNA_ORIENTATION=-
MSACTAQRSGQMAASESPAFRPSGRACAGEELGAHPCEGPRLASAQLVDAGGPLQRPAPQSMQGGVPVEGSGPGVRPPGPLQGPARASGAESGLRKGPLRVLLVLVDLLERLALAYQVRFARAIHEHLRRLGEGVVVLGGHAAAVGSGALDEHQVADLRALQGPVQERLRLARRAGEEVTRLAAVARDNVGRALGRGRVARRVRGHHNDRVLGAVQGRAEDVRHAGVELHEVVALRPRGGPAGARHVLHPAQQAACIGHEEGARLDLELELAAVLLREGLEGVAHGGAHLGEVRGHLGPGARHLEPAAQVERLHSRDLAAQLQREARHALPDRGVRPGADVGVHLVRVQAVPLHELQGLREALVPDAEAARGPAHVGLARGARAQAWVEAQADARAGARLAKGLELGQGAGVHHHAELDELRHVLGQLLGAQGELLRGIARGDRAAALVPRGGVDVDAPVTEEAQHRAIREGLHGEAHREAVRVGELQRRARLPGQRAAVIDVGRSAVRGGHAAGEVRGEEGEGIQVRRGPRGAGSDEARR